MAESGAVLYDNVSFANAADDVTVPEGDYTLEVRPATEANGGDVVATFNVPLEGGTTYSALAVGYLNPADAPTDRPAVHADRGDGRDGRGAGDDPSPTPTDEGTETPTASGM